MLLEVITSIALMGAAGTNGNMPFWATTNRFGLMPESSGALTVASVSSDSLHLGKLMRYGFGAQMALRSDAANSHEFIPAQCYANIGIWHISADIGIRHRTMDYMAPEKALGSLSITSGSMAWTGNTRSYPGVTLSLSPTDILPGKPGTLQIWGSYGDYYMTDERSVRDGLLHSMNVFLRYSHGRFRFTAGLDHFAQWAGWNDEHRFPSSWNAYFRVITGMAAGPDGTINDQLNVLGDHLGAETFKFEYSFPQWKLSFQHDIPYADKSGMYFKNFPDGVNTLCLSRNDRHAWISDIVLEIIYTEDQSGLIHDRPATEKEMARQDPEDYFYGRVIEGGLDNYGNNGEYCSGWTVYGRSAYLPLFFPKGTKDGSWSREGVTLGLENNLVRACHVGISGFLGHRLPYRFMCTWSANSGVYRRKNVTTTTWKGLTQLSTGLDIMTRESAHGFQGFCGIYCDYGEVLARSAALILGLSYNIR